MERVNPYLPIFEARFSLPLYKPCWLAHELLGTGESPPQCVHTGMTYVCITASVCHASSRDPDSGHQASAASLFAH